jgi:hypothetical protein
MPQTTYLPLFHASYPVLAGAQKPGGVVVSTTLGPNATPNVIAPQLAPPPKTNNKSKK